MKISELIGNTLKTADGRECGYVRGVYACGGKISYLACADFCEREFNADFNSLAFTPNGIIFTAEKNKTKSAPVRLGLPAYTENGRFAGFVKDIFIEKGEIKYYLIGNKRHPAAALNVGDAVIIKGRRVLKYDVVKDKKVILKKGTEVDGLALKTAQAAGEYIQTQLKSL